MRIIKGYDITDKVTFWKDEIEFMDVDALIMLF